VHQRWETILYAESDQQLLLAARPPSRLQRRVAYGVMAVLLATLCIVAPYANLPLQRFTAFIPVCATAMAIIDLSTAALIFAQFWVVRWTWLLVLACGFWFTGLLAVPYALTFPEAFAPSGLLGAGAQTAAQLSLCSRLVSPTVLIIAILVREARRTASIWQRSPGPAIVLSIALVSAIVCGLTWAIVANDHILPRIDVYRLHNNLDLLLPIIALTLIPLVLLWVRGRSVLDLWLMVMCCSWVFDLSLVIIADSRYSLGWYIARTFQMAAVFFILLLFLSEATALYANLVRASIQRRGAHHTRQIAMDVMAASIGHEIKQPLTGLLINAEACIRQLRKAEPDLEEVHATFSDIVADGQRIKDIIGGVQTMFRGSAHDRRLLDINEVVRDALATVDLELGHQGAIVRTDLDNDLPPILADKGQLHQVFLNLITNALEAMAAASDRPSLLRVTSGVVQGSSDIAVTVEDTGVGIPDKDSGRILEPFFSTKIAGTGVGLTICRVILKAHGGRMHLSTNQPHGTIVRVILPSVGDE
jgi:signal transduction histidine kinase